MTGKSKGERGSCKTVSRSTTPTGLGPGPPGRVSCRERKEQCPGLLGAGVVVRGDVEAPGVLLGPPATRGLNDDDVQGLGSRARGPPTRPLRPSVVSEETKDGGRQVPRGRRVDPSLTSLYSCPQGPGSCPVSVERPLERPGTSVLSSDPPRPEGSQVGVRDVGYVSRRVGETRRTWVYVRSNLLVTTIESTTPQDGQGSVGESRVSLVDLNSVLRGRPFDTSGVSAVRPLNPYGRGPGSCFDHKPGGPSHS